MKPGPHELAQQHPQKRGVKNDLVMHQMKPCPREVGDRNHKSVGTDFRYAVEFSKNGRAPSAVSQPAWGQPDLRYRLASTIPNRRSPAVPDSPAKRKLRQLRLAELIIGGCPRAVQLRWILAIRPLCGSPWGMEEVTGSIAPASNLQVSGLIGDRIAESVQVSRCSVGCGLATAERGSGDHLQLFVGRAERPVLRRVWQERSLERAVLDGVPAARPGPATEPAESRTNQGATCERGRRRQPASPAATPGTCRAAGRRRPGHAPGRVIRTLLMLAPPSATARRASDSDDASPVSLSICTTVRPAGNLGQAGFRKAACRVPSSMPASSPRPNSAPLACTTPSRAASPCTSRGQLTCQRPLRPPWPVAAAAVDAASSAISSSEPHREHLEVAADVPVVGVEPELVEGVGTGHLGIEPDGPTLGLAEFGAVRLGDQRRRHRMHRASLDLANQFGAAGQIAPLVTAACLQGAAVPPVQLQVVHALQDLVAELGEREPFVAVQPGRHRFLGQHPAHPEVLADVTQEADGVEFRRPVEVVDHQRSEWAIEVDVVLDLGPDPLHPAGDDRPASSAPVPPTSADRRSGPVAPPTSMSGRCPACWIRRIVSN